MATYTVPSGEYVVTDVDMPGRPIRVGVGSTIEAARENLSVTPFSVPQDERKAIAWAFSEDPSFDLDDLVEEEEEEN